MRTASRSGVIDELMYPDQEFEEYTGDDGESLTRLANRGPQAMTKEQAESLVDKYKELLDVGMKLGSYSYYVAGQIREAESKQQ